MDSLRITKPDKPVKTEVLLPSSKSVSNRLLIMQALAQRDFKIQDLSAAEDTLLLEKLLLKIYLGRKRKDAVKIDCRDAGTVFRFLTPFLAVRPGKWILTGTERMKQRPIGPLADALRDMGASIEYMGKPGFPPLRIKGKNLRGSEVTLDAGVSSQFISALMMVAPYIGGLTIRLQGEIVSEPYLSMTASLMRRCGAEISRAGHVIRISEGKYSCRNIRVEADWSSASFWFMAAALSRGSEIELGGLLKNSVQGDSVLPELFAPFGVKTTSRAGRKFLLKSGLKSPVLAPGLNTLGVQGSIGLKDHPDLALPLIATTAALGLGGWFHGLKSLAIKESDRLNALATELGKLGCRMDEPDEEGAEFGLRPSTLAVSPGTVIQTYGDHRMAMTFAMLSLATGSIIVENPDAVAKSYPGFWNDLKAAGFRVESFQPLPAQESGNDYF
jgi:3-phosphoshikimate 1-carboxyvinyltransferase